LIEPLAIATIANAVQARMRHGSIQIRAHSTASTRSACSKIATNTSCTTSPASETLASMR
jgi:hypothetical protein